MELWAIISMTFLAKSRLRIRLHIYYVLNTFRRFWALQFQRNFHSKCVLALGLQKRPSLYHLFSSLGENVLKWVSKWEGGKVKKLLFFVIGFPLGVPGFIFLTFGFPGHHFGTLLGALSIILAPLGPTKMMPRQCKIQ